MNRSPLASAGPVCNSPGLSFARDLHPDAAVLRQDARDFEATTPDTTDFSGFRSVKCYVSKRGRTRLRTGEWREIRCRETEHLRKTCGNGKDVRQSSYSYDELLACGRGELFGPGNAQLPLPPMLMFDRITEISEDGGEHGLGSVRAELDVKSDLWFFPCHFQGDPVMPGCLGLDALWQMTGFFLGWLGEPGRGRAISTGEIKFSKMVTPETRLVEYGVDIKRLRRGRLVLGIADGWLKADGETIYQAKDLRVGLFRTE